MQDPADLCCRCSSQRFQQQFAAGMSSQELNESELGTQEFWNNRYKTEIDNFKNHGDVGEIWFGEESIDRVCRWIIKSPSITEDKRIIDLGCGNGLFLVELAKEGFTNLLGVDYSEDAIILAKEIVKKENFAILYKVFDILNNKIESSFDLVHDKGTYDAISLSSDAKTNRKKYIEQVESMLEDDGLYIITSCNWTKEELQEHFSVFKLLQQIPTPQFKFGGRAGSTVTTLIFQRNKTI